jgi:hypothetical protein
VPVIFVPNRSLGDEEDGDDEDTDNDYGKDRSSPDASVEDVGVPQSSDEKRGADKYECDDHGYEEDDDYDEDFIKTFLDHAVDAPCQRLAVAPCVADLVDRQMDLFMVRTGSWPLLDSVKLARAGC